ncbi:hypothetical protein ACQI4L_06950 [Mycolicibacterium litorale]|uniref:hypothetical protein n=1 Tax=Mycolicibacterium litorale TaxID=758802 RepID=UPI003CF7EE23
MQLLEVNPEHADRVVGVVNSPSAASRLVGEWLEALVTGKRADGTAATGPGTQR